MFQLSLRYGLKIFGKKGKETAQEKMKQIHDMSTFKPILAKYPSKEEGKLFFSSLILLKYKINGDIKDRSCEDGQPKRHKMKKSDTTSPTVSTESVFITSTIDEFKGQNVVNMGIHCDLLYTPMEPYYPKVHMALKGKFTEIIVKVETKLSRKCFGTDINKCVIFYVEIK